MKLIKNFILNERNSHPKYSDVKPNNLSSFCDTDEKAQISVKWNEEETSFSFQNFQNETLWFLNAPICCAKLSPNLKHVWLVERKSEEQVIVWLYDYEGNLKASLGMKDIISHSYYSMELLPEPHKISIEMAGGQDGCRTYFLVYDEIYLQVVEELVENHSFLFTFEEDTKAILINFYENYIFVVSYPKCEPLYRYHLPNDLTFERLTPITPRIWLLNDLHWRHFLFDSHAMSITDEIIIEGYEPQVNEWGILEGVIDRMKCENGKIIFTIREFFEGNPNINEKYKWGSFEVEELLDDD